MAFEELKQRQSAVWGQGPYQRVTETIADIHDAVVASIDPQPGERWLDLACGTGAVAERAAARGARVTGVDLAPALLETARERAESLGLEIDYRFGDCERLELDDASFDIVSSTCGIMFSPDHAASAGELARVTRPGGRIALANWTPDPGGVKALFEVMVPFQPAPPPSSPFDWGAEENVRTLLGDSFDLAFEFDVSTFRAPTAGDYWELFSTSYGPTKALADALGERRGELRRAWVERFETGGAVEHDRPYLLVLGTRR